MQKTFYILFLSLMILSPPKKEIDDYASIKIQTLIVLKAFLKSVTEKTEKHPQYKEFERDFIKVKSDFSSLFITTTSVLTELNKKKFDTLLELNSKYLDSTESIFKDKMLEIDQYVQKELKQPLDCLKKQEEELENSNNVLRREVSSLLKDNDCLKAQLNFLLKKNEIIKVGVTNSLKDSKEDLEKQLSIYRLNLEQTVNDRMDKKIKKLEEEIKNILEQVEDLYSSKNSSQQQTDSLSSFLSANQYSGENNQMRLEKMEQQIELLQYGYSVIFQQLDRRVVTLQPTQSSNSPYGYKMFSK